MNHFYMLDIFGTNFYFTNFGKKKFHTSFGLILSIILYILVATFIGVFGLDLFNRLNPKIISEQVRPLMHKLITLNPYNFTLAWRIQDENGSTWNFTDVLFPLINYQDFERNNSTGIFDLKETTIKTELCNEDNVKDPLFKIDRKLEMWNCIDFNKYNFKVGGYWEESDFIRLFSIHILFCHNNDRGDPRCRTLEELKELLIQKKKLYFTLIFPVFYFEPGNLQSPLRYEYQEYFQGIDLNLNKRERIYFKPIELQDDQNILLTEFKSSNITVFRGFQNEASVKFDNDIENKLLGSDIYSFLIYFDKGGDRFIRSYMKPPTVAAKSCSFM